jgi:hypothetical protein
MLTARKWLDDKQKKQQRLEQALEFNRPLAVLHEKRTYDSCGIDKVIKSRLNGI